MIYVIDMNHNNSLDLSKVPNTVGGFIFKARQGTGYGDPKYLARSLAARAAGYEVGAYDYATGDNVRENVATFIKYVRSTADSRTSYWLDFEDNDKSQMSMLQACEFLDRVDQATGRRCGIYGGNRIKEHIVDIADMHREFLGAHPLWLCQYNTHYSLLDKKGHPLPWTKPTLWQRWADTYKLSKPGIPGVEADTDLSVFDGDRKKLADWWPLPTVETQSGK